MENIVDKAIKDGCFTIYTNTDPEVAGQVRMYNATASRLRARMKRLHHIRYWHIGMNILMILFFCFYRPNMMFGTPALGALLMFINFVALFRYV